VTDTATDTSRRTANALPLALALMAGPAVALGLARFAYALVLPDMRADLHWSFAVAGALNTANALGYLVGALVTVPIAARVGERWAFAGGLIVTIAALFGSAVTGEVGVLLVTRLLAGASGAVVFVVGGGLVARLGFGRSTRTSTMLLGVYFAGPGAGIVASGLLVPAALTTGSWRWAWLALGALGVLALAVAVPAAWRVPEVRPARGRGGGRWPVRPLAWLLVAYTLFGAGYIAYMTFIVAYLQRHGAGGTEITVFWAVLGLMSVAAGFLWGHVLGRMPIGAGMAMILLILTVGAALPLVPGGLAPVYASAVVFGGTFLTVVTATTAAVRRTLEQRHWTPAIAGMTVAFALGQCVGPVLAGALSDRAGGVRTGLLIGAGLLLLGAAAAATHRTRRTDTGRGLGSPG
jgi:predicted MFS family arabinose efflux permease